MSRRGNRSEVPPLGHLAHAQQSVLAHVIASIVVTELPNELASAKAGGPARSLAASYSRRHLVRVAIASAIAAAYVASSTCERGSTCHAHRPSVPSMDSSSWSSGSIPASSRAARTTAARSALYPASVLPVHCRETSTRRPPKPRFSGSCPPLALSRHHPGAAPVGLD